MSHDESAEELMARGFELIEAGRLDDAIEVGMQLQELRHTSAFEILALAYAGLDDLPQAVATLEAGVEKGPSVWRLWQLLGNTRCDMGRHDEACRAYARALTCPNVDASSVHLNLSISLSREGKYEEALGTLHYVTSPELVLHAACEKVGILAALGRYDEAIACGESHLSRANETEHGDGLGALEAALGLAWWHGRRDRQRACDLAWAALDHARGADGALWLIREIEHRLSPTAKYLRLMIEGIWPEPGDDGEELGFFTPYDVVADSPEEAMRYIRRLEPADFGDTLQVVECEEIESCPDSPAGVCAVGPYHLFPRDAEP